MVEHAVTDPRPRHTGADLDRWVIDKLRSWFANMTRAAVYTINTRAWRNARDPGDQAGVGGTPGGGLGAVGEAHAPRAYSPSDEACLGAAWVGLGEVAVGDLLTGRGPAPSYARNSHSRNRAPGTPLAPTLASPLASANASRKPALRHRPAERRAGSRRRAVDGVHRHRVQARRCTWPESAISAAANRTCRS